MKIPSFAGSVRTDGGQGRPACPLFRLAAMPGLTGGTPRVLPTFLVPLRGTRKVVSIASLLPLVGWFPAVRNPAASCWVLAQAPCRDSPSRS